MGSGVSTGGILGAIVKRTRENPEIIPQLLQCMHDRRVFKSLWKFEFYSGIESLSCDFGGVFLVFQVPGLTLDPLDPHLRRSSSVASP